MYQFADGKFLWPDAIQGRNESTKYMVAPPKFMPFFDNPHILGPLHNAEDLLVPPRICADGTGVGFGKTAADRTAADVAVEVLELFSQLPGITWVSVEYEIGKSACGFFANPG
jgi:hypothetical protein